MSGGWKIVKNMGTRITKVTPFEGVRGNSWRPDLFITEAMKLPVSTTHTITGAIMGVGAHKTPFRRSMGVTVNLCGPGTTIPVSGLWPQECILWSAFHIIR